MTYIIAEVGGNHNGSLETAIKLIHEAKKAGCDAVKFQTYQAEKLVHPQAQALPQAKGYTRQIDRFKDLEFTQEQWDYLIEECKQVRIDFLTTCFDIETLERFAPKMKFIKISSGDLTYSQLLRAAALYGKPVLLSTGMSSLPEVESAAIHFSPNLLTVLQCTSSYPCSDEDANLGVITDLQRTFNSVGYSDHTVGITACLVAAGLGCTVIEKHFTLDNTLDYGDHCLSSTPEEMEALVYNVRRIERMLGHAKPAQVEKETRKKMRRGPYASRPIKMGQVISEQDVVYLRPEGKDVIGKRARKDYSELEMING